MRLREFAPSPSNEPSGDFPMSWDQIVDRFRQILNQNLGWQITAGPGRTATFVKGPMTLVIRQDSSPKQIQYYINDGNRSWKGFKFTMWSSITQLLDTVRSLPLKEFAPSPGYGGDGDDEGDVPRYLMHLANLWWNQADPEAQQEVEREIRAGGWTIQQIDDDTVLLHHISDDNFDPDLHEAEQNFAIASQIIPGDKFKLTINNRPFVLTPGGFGKQHSQVFLDSFYLTDMKSGKTEFVDSWYNWPLAKAIADHLDQNHADALVRIGKADFAWHEKNNDWNSQPPRLQGIRRQTSVGIPAKDFVKSVDAVKRVTGQDQ